MDKYIDFTDCPVDPYKGFRGAKGKKISITYNNEKYMLKFQTPYLVNSDCTAALKRIYPRINMEKINAIIDNTPHLSSVERSFYKEMLHQRKTKILDFSMEKLKEKERSRKLCYKGLSR